VEFRNIAPAKRPTFNTHQFGSIIAFTHCALVAVITSRVGQRLKHGRLTRLASLSPGFFSSHLESPPVKSATHDTDCPTPKETRHERVFSEPDRITIIVKTKSKQALCPQCHSPSAQTRSIKLNNASGLVGVWLVALLQTLQSPRGDCYPGVNFISLISKNCYLNSPHINV